MRVQIIYLLFATDAKTSFNRDKKPLLEGDLGVGNPVVREILNKIFTTRQPTPNPSQEGNNL